MDALQSPHFLLSQGPQWLFYLLTVTFHLLFQGPNTSQALLRCKL